MENFPPWAKALDISEESLQKWLQDTPANCPLAFHALKKHNLPQEDYLAWARKYYQLASINPQFFNEPVDTEMWFSVKIEYQWSPWFLPLKIWDNTIFVGCVEPPAELPKTSMPIQLVLCPRDGLEKLWKAYMSDMGVEVTGKTSLTKTGKLVLELKNLNLTSASIKLNQPVKTNTDIKTDLAKPVAEKPIIQKEKPTAARPPFEKLKPKLEPATAPLKTNSQPLADLNFGQLSLARAGEVEAEKKDTPILPPSTPTPTVSSDTISRFEITTTNHPLAKTEQQKPPPQVTPAPPPTVTSTNASEKLKTPAGMPKPLVPPPPPKRPAPLAAKAELVGSLSGRVVPLSRGGKLIKPNEVPIPPNADLARNIDELAAYAFKEMAATFEKQMFLIYDDFKLVVCRWSEGWQPITSHISTPIAIDKPGIFKIVHDTKKAFHGSVAFNGANQIFFDCWNNSEVPKHITICPVFHGRGLFGHLLGATNNEVETYSSLNFMMRLCDMLSKNNSKSVA